VFTSQQFVIGCIAAVGNDWGFHTFMTLGPKYLKGALGFDVEKVSCTCTEHGLLTMAHTNLHKHAYIYLFVYLFIQFDFLIFRPPLFPIFYFLCFLQSSFHISFFYFFSVMNRLIDYVNRT
jgi:hypothetical protein